MSSPLLLSDCKRAVANLNTLNNEELDTIMNDDDKITEILDSLNQSYLREIQNEKENIIKENESIAESNLSREPELVEGREKLQQLTQEGEELSKRLEEKTKELRQKSGDLSMETSLALLQTAASEMEEESDNFAKKFLDSGVELEEFLEQFLSKRRLMHLRAVKAEKLAKLLLKNPALGGNTNYINTPPMSVNSNYFPGVPSHNVPYPTGPVGMPMPPGMNYFQNHY